MIIQNEVGFKNDVVTTYWVVRTKDSTRDQVTSCWFKINRTQKSWVNTKQKIRGGDITSGWIKRNIMKHQIGETEHIRRRVVS